jgi:protein SCO1/2
MFKRFLAILVFLALLMMLLACQPDYEFQGSVMDPPQPIPDFTLTDAQGHPFRLSDLNSDYALIYFGYTFCPDFCPLTLTKAAAALAEIDGGLERVQIIFISVDPERDTPEALQTYLNRYQDQWGATFIGLSDDWAKLEPVLQSFGAFAQKETVENSAAGYLMSHTTRLYVVNKQGEWLLHYPFEAEAEAIGSDLAYLLTR